MSGDRLLEHRRLWRRKPVLAEVYAVWFDELLAALGRPRRVLEVGAGPGFLSEYARTRRPEALWVSSDIATVPWNDVVADALRLPFRDGSFEAVTGFDIVHHLARPADFFRETVRVLAPGGRIACVEPWITPFSRPIYRFLHQEGYRPGLDPWRPFPDAKQAFEGDGGLVSGLLRRARPSDWLALGLGQPRLRTLCGFAYLLSLGFRRGSLLPRPLCRPLLALDRALSRFSGQLGMRALLVWERADSP